MSFAQRIDETATLRQSNIVLALDLPREAPRKLLEKAKAVLEDVYTKVCAVKFNRHLILPLGLFGDVQELLSMAKDYGLPTIMDCKVNDIGNTNRTIAEYYYGAGFGALTANPFVGWSDGLQPIFDTANRLGRGVILLVYMSHKGASEGYGQRVLQEGSKIGVHQYQVFAKKALQYNADGAVVGATYPEVINDVHAVLGQRVPIYSPGIGAQGGKVHAALGNGAKYLIVGRAITSAKDPSKAATRIRALAMKAKLGAKIGSES